MKPSILLAAAQLFNVALASPLFIITAVPEPQKRDVLSQLKSALSQENSPTAVVGPPVAASSTPTGPDPATLTSSPDPTSTDDGNDDSTTSTTVSSSTSSTPPPGTTSAPMVTPTPTATPTGAANGLTSGAKSSSKSSSDGNGVPAAGIVVAVIAIISLIVITIWLIFRYNPRANAWLVARQEKAAKDRSWRDALDGPFAAGKVREKALSDDGSSARPNRKSILTSFFAPRTVKLGGGREIRRKPVNWGAESVPPTPTSLGNQSLSRSVTGNEQTGFAAKAAPMGQADPAALALARQSVVSVGGGFVSDTSGNKRKSVNFSRPQSSSASRAVPTGDADPAALAHARMSLISSTTTDSPGKNKEKRKSRPFSMPKATGGPMGDDGDAMAFSHARESAFFDKDSSSDRGITMTFSSPPGVPPLPMLPPLDFQSDTAPTVVSGPTTTTKPLPITPQASTKKKSGDVSTSLLSPVSPLTPENERQRVTNSPPVLPPLAALKARRDSSGMFKLT